MRRRLFEIVELVGLLAALDQLYRWLHPEVDFVRATLVGASAWLSLRVLERLHVRVVSPVRGALVVFSSAFLSVALIQTGALVSRSPASVAVHVALVVLACLASEGMLRARRSAAS